MKDDSTLPRERETVWVICEGCMVFRVYADTLQPVECSHYDPYWRDLRPRMGYCAWLMRSGRDS